MIIAVPLCTIFLTIGFWVLFNGIRLCIQAHETKRWEPSTGEITESLMEISRDSEGDDLYEAKIIYVYSFNNKTYHGKKIFFGYSPTKDKQNNESLIDYFPVGKQVTVYTNRARPDESVLIPGIQRFTFTKVWLGIFIAFWGLWFFVMWYLFGMPAVFKSIRFG